MIWRSYAEQETSMGAPRATIRAKEKLSATGASKASERSSRPLAATLLDHLQRQKRISPGAARLMASYARER